MKITKKSWFSINFRVTSFFIFFKILTIGERGFQITQNPMCGREDVCGETYISTNLTLSNKR